MIAAALLHPTLDLLTAVQSTPRPADAVTSAWFRAHRAFDDSQRGAMLELLYALLRHRARLGWWLERLGSADSPRNRLLAWLTLAEGKTPAQITQLFNSTKPAPLALTNRDKALLMALRGGTIAHPDMPADVALECPPWALAPLQQRFGLAFEAEMAATLVAPPLDLRVNPMKSTRESVLRHLQGMGLQAEATKLSPFGIRLHQRLSLTRLSGLKTGEIEIQDEGSQLVALLVDAKPGARVVDFCAGAGGKTLAIAAQMQNKGHIIACDINPARLKRCAERLKRAGLHNVETRVIASETDPWIKRHKGRFDHVLIDAPCSGTGTWRRNPDARGRAPDLGLEALVALQGRILASAARLLKPGGRLVYATCSVLSEENEAQVAAFLTAHPAFQIVPVQVVAPHLAEAVQSGHLSLTPARHQTDGFFAAILQRDAVSATYRSESAVLA